MKNSRKSVSVIKTLLAKVNIKYSFIELKNKVEKNCP